MEKILLVEDDPTVADIILEYIRADARYEVCWAPGSQQALEMAHQGFSLILLDIMLPGIDGMELCQRFRRTLYCPIVFISSLDDEKTIVQALQLGGDDYLVKPFRAAVLLAKIDAHLRRMRNDFPALELDDQEGDLRLNSQDHTVHTPTGQAYLSPTEFRLLQFLFHNRRRVLELEEIYQAIWEKPSFGDVRTVPVHVCNLRKKIEREPNRPQYLKTVKRIGYWFDDTPED